MLNDPNSTNQNKKIFKLFFLLVIFNISIDWNWYIGCSWQSNAWPSVNIIFSPRSNMDSKWEHKLRKKAASFTSGHVLFINYARCLKTSQVKCSYSCQNCMYIQYSAPEKNACKCKYERTNGKNKKELKSWENLCERK